MNTPKTVDWTVSLDSGKYLLVHFKEGGLEAMRHGLAWRDLTGDSLVYWLGSDLAELRRTAAELALAVHELYGSASTDTITIPGQIDDRIRKAYDELNKALSEQLPSSKLFSEK